MTGFAVIGIIVSIIIGFCWFPRTAFCITLGIFIGGYWWILFGILAFIGFIVDLFEL